VGVPVAPTQPTSAAPASTTTDPRLDTLVNSVSQLSSTVDQLSNTVGTLSKGFDTLSSTVSQLSQGFNSISSTVETLAKIVAATTGVPSNGSSSTPPAAPDSTTPPAAPAAPTGNPTVSPAPPANSASSVLTRNPMTLVDDSGGLYHNTPLTGNSNQMVDDINNAKKIGTRKHILV